MLKLIPGSGLPESVRQGFHREEAAAATLVSLIVFPVMPVSLSTAPPDPDEDSSGNLAGAGSATKGEASGLQCRVG